MDPSSNLGKIPSVTLVLFLFIVVIWFGNQDCHGVSLVKKIGDLCFGDDCPETLTCFNSTRQCYCSSGFVEWNETTCILSCNAVDGPGCLHGTCMVSGYCKCDVD